MVQGRAAGDGAGHMMREQRQEEQQGTGQMLPCAWWLVPAEPWHGVLQRMIRELAARYGGPVFEPHMTLALGELPAGWLWLGPEASSGARSSGMTDPAAGQAGVPGHDFSSWAGMLPALTLSSGGVGHTAHFFQAFHLRLAPSQAEQAQLDAWRNDLRATLTAVSLPSHPVQQAGTFQETDTAVGNVHGASSSWAGRVRVMHQGSVPVRDIHAPSFSPHLSLAYGHWPPAQREAAADGLAPDASLARITFDTLVGVCPRPGARSLSRVQDWYVFARIPLTPSRAG